MMIAFNDAARALAFWPVMPMTAVSASQSAAARQSLQSDLNCAAVAKPRS
jgi:hypothetical protein